MDRGTECLRKRGLESIRRTAATDGVAPALHGSSRRQPRAQRGGAFEYFTLRREGEEQAALYRRPAPAIRGDRIDPSGTYELVLDPRALGGKLTTSVDVVAVAPNGDHLIYGVRDGGQAERELVVRDLKTMTDVERFPAALYDSVSPRKDGAGFQAIRLFSLLQNVRPARYPG